MNIKCAECKTEMVKGSLMVHGYAWRKGDSVSLPNKGIIAAGKPKTDPVNAWRCPNCGNVQLRIDINNKEAL